MTSFLSPSASSAAPNDPQQTWAPAGTHNQSFVDLISALSLADPPDDLEDEGSDVSVDEYNNTGAASTSSRSIPTTAPTSLDEHVGPADDFFVEKSERGDSERVQTDGAIQEMMEEAGTLSGQIESADGVDAAESFVQHPKPLNEAQKALKLSAIAEEFGGWSGKPGESAEEYIGDIPAVIYRSVLVKGILIMTSKRLLFIAYLPTSHVREPIVSGPVKMTMPEKCGKKSARAWLELYHDSVAVYPNSTKLYTPIFSRPLSEFSSILDEIDPAHPNRFTVRLIGDIERILTFDTPETAREWRAKLLHAIFSYRHSRGKLRVSVPLDRILYATTHAFLGYCQQVTIKFDSMTNTAKDAPPETPGMSRQSTSASASSIGSRDESEADSFQDVAFGVLNRYSWAFDDLQSRLTARGPFSADTITSSPPLVDTEENEECIEEDKLQDRPSASPQAELKRVFSLADDAETLYVTKCELVKIIPASGRLCISKEFLCFFRKSLAGKDIRIRLPLSHIHSVDPGKIFGFHVYGLVVRILGQADVWFEFHSKSSRDKTIDHLRKALPSSLPSSSTETLVSSPILSPLPRSQTSGSDKQFSITTDVTRPNPTTWSTVSKQDSTESTTSTSRTILEQTASGDPEPCVEVRFVPDELGSVPQVLGVDCTDLQITRTHFMCMTIGSRGDVQPYIALCKELMKDGHRCTIASHPEYEDWCKSFGIGFKPIGGDPAALMKLSTEHSFFSVGFFKESLGKWLDDLLMDCWQAAQDADVLIESPSTMAGIHVAEALQIPYIRAFTMCWTRTSAYPHAFAVPPVEMGPQYNLMTYSLFENILWKATSGQINRWRVQTLHLPKTDLDHMEQKKVPFVYNFSAAVCPRPNDWRDGTCISGYWFLDNSDSEWTAPEDLIKFLADARQDGVPVIYVGFGSIVLEDPVTVRKNIYEATQAAKVRAIVSAGWSGRLAKQSPMPEKPDNVYLVDAIPHDWLFPQIAAACHHGGAGSTGASLRAGIVTIIKPFFGDQFFWGQMVSKAGAGVKLSSLNTKELSGAFSKAVTHRVMREKAQIVGAKIRQENGVRTAKAFIYSRIGGARDAARVKRVKTLLEV